MTVRAEGGRGASGAPGASNLSGVSSLLRKDLAVFSLRDRFLFVLVYLLAHPMVLPSQDVFFWLGVGLAGALALFVPIMEWHQETDRMLSSLPVRRATVVFARYLTSALACGVAGIAWISTGRVLTPILNGMLDAGQATPGMFTTFEGIVSFFLVAGLMLSLFLPLYFRFGLGRGGLVFWALFMGFYGLASLTGGLVVPGRTLAERLSALAASVGPGWVLLLVLVGLGTVAGLSERLSVRWFEGRDL